MNEKKVSRRYFLKKFTMAASSAIAAPYVITSNALGNGVIPPASDRVTLGHIGIGNRGGSLLRSFLQLDCAQSIAVCDPFKSRREQRVNQIDEHYAGKYSASNYNSCKAYNDFRDLLARNDIDAIVVATPDHWHVPISLYAARAGKDMYVEKPLGVSVTENITLRETIRTQGNIFQYGTQQRSGRDFRYACELVRNKRIGELHTIHVWCPGMYAFERFHAPGGSITPIPVPDGFDYDMWLGPATVSPYTSDRCTEWGSYYHYDNSLGFIAGWGAHPLDIAQWGNNSDHTVPIEYEGTGTIFNKGLYNVIDSWDMWCRYENGVKMRFMSDGIARPIVEKYHPKFISHGTTFLGTQGWISVDRAGIYADPPSLLKSVIGPGDIHLDESFNHSKNFVDCVKTRSQPISPIAAAVQSDIICHLCDIAIRLNRSIRWDPKREVVINDETANRMFSRPMRSPWRL